MDNCVTLAEAALAVATARDQGEIIVLANGAFDLLHVGHVRYLVAAKALGDKLVVAVNTDASVRRSKGAERPIIPLAERMELLCALRCVDWVVPFGEDTAHAIIGALRPHIQAKGTDYRAEEVAEGVLVASYGGRVAIVGDPKDHATSRVIAQLRTPSPRDRYSRGDAVYERC